MKVAMNYLDSTSHTVRTAALSMSPNNSMRKKEAEISGRSKLQDRAMKINGMYRVIPKNNDIREATEISKSPTQNSKGSV